MRSLIIERKLEQQRKIMGLHCKECDTKITFKMVEKRNKGFFCYCDGCEKDKYSFQVTEYKSILRLTDED